MCVFFYPNADALPERYRHIRGIPFEEIRIDPRALLTACEDYEAATGDVDEVAFGRALMTYLEGAES